MVLQRNHKRKGFPTFNDASHPFNPESMPKIYLHLNSTGGDIYASFAAVDAIKQSRLPVITIIEGMVCSGASLISIVGWKRRMNRHSYLMIHELSIVNWSGRYSELQEHAHSLQHDMKMMRQLYETHSLRRVSITD